MAEEARAKIAEGLASRGGHNLGGLRRQFKILDDNGNKRLSAEDLKYGLQDFIQDITTEECQEFLTLADTEGNGDVTFDEFLCAIKGPMNDFRRECVDKAYNKFDADGGGSVTIEDIKGVYNTDSHPKVESGEMTSDEVFADFLGAFGDKDGDGTISKEEWYSYYDMISASIDDDEYFKLMIDQAW